MGLYGYGPRAASDIPLDIYEEQSILDQLGSTALTGLRYVAAPLDLVSSSVRDLLVGENPLDQWATPFSFENRTEGREVLEHMGLLSENEEGLDTGDVLGFGFEVATDPLTYMTFGGSAVGKLGKFLKHAGVHADDVARVASRAAGKKIGKRAARLATTWDDIVKHGGELTPKIEKQALREGLDPADLASHFGDETVGGLGRFVGSDVTFGKGKLSQKAAGWMDRFGEVVSRGKIPGTEFSPGMQFQRLFRKKSGGVGAPELADEASRLERHRQDIVRTANQDVARVAGDMMDADLLDDTMNPVYRAMLESTDIDAPELFEQIVKDAEKVRPDVRDAIEQAKPFMDRITELKDQALRDWQSIGGKVDELERHFPRSPVDYVLNRAYNMSREEYLTQFKGGTEMLRQVIKDPKIMEGGVDEAADYVIREYGDMLRPLDDYKAERLTRDGTYGREYLGVEREGAGAASARQKSNVLRLVKSARELTEIQRSEGLFNRNVLADLNDYLTGMKVRTASRAGAGAVLAQHLKLPTEIAGETATKTMADVTRELNLMSEGARQLQPGVGDEALNLAEGFGRGAPGGTPKRTGFNQHVENLLPEGKLDEMRAMVQQSPDLYDKVIDDMVRQGLDPTSPQNRAVHDEAVTKIALESMVVEERLFNDIVGGIGRRTGSGLKAVESQVVQAWDSITNLFKMGVLTRPARYVRDFVSGTVQNVLTGNFSPKAFNSTRKLIAGETVDFTHIPEIKVRLKAENKALNAENSTRMMQRLIFEEGLASGWHGFQGAGEVVGGSADDLGRAMEFTSKFAGTDPMDPLSPSGLADFLKSGAPAKSLDAWNPLKTAGVFGEVHTGFKPAAVGQRFGKWTDEMNRITPFIKNLEQGMDPRTAGQIANGLQVDYGPSAYTGTEREVMRRLFPFYSFTRGIVPEIMRRLAEHPGGGLGQALRASESATDPSGAVPEHVASTLAIPLQGMPGFSKDDPSYLSGAGLMHEDILPLVGSGGIPFANRPAAREVASRLHPLIKFPAEEITGQSFWRSGAGGSGEPLADLDPTMGRTLANIRQMVTGEESYRPDPIGGRFVEHAVSNSPVSAYTRMGRVATDPRKTAIEKLMNIFTGFRTTTISEAQEDKIIKDRLNLLRESMGARQFPKTYFPEEEHARIDAEHPGLREALDKLEKLIRQRAKRRKKERE